MQKFLRILLICCFSFVPYPYIIMPRGWSSFKFGRAIIMCKYTNF